MKVSQCRLHSNLQKLFATALGFLLVLLSLARAVVVEFSNSRDVISQAFGSDVQITLGSGLLLLLRLSFPELGL